MTILNSIKLWKQFVGTSLMVLKYELFSTYFTLKHIVMKQSIIYATCADVPLPFPELKGVNPLFPTLPIPVSPKKILNYFHEVAKLYWVACSAVFIERSIYSKMGRITSWIKVKISLFIISNTMKWGVLAIKPPPWLGSFSKIPKGWRPEEILLHDPNWAGGLTANALKFHGITLQYHVYVNSTTPFAVHYQKIYCH